MKNSKLNLNTSTVTKIKRSKSTTIDCIRARANFDGVTVSPSEA